MSGAARPPGPAFLAGFVIAQAGAFLSFLPLLQILLPLKALAVGGAGHVALLGEIAAAGAFAGGAANLAAGHLSDRTRSRWGRRRPWLLGGVCAVMVSYALIWAAATPLALLAGIVLFQAAFNALFAPLVALVPDRVPESRRGWVAGLFALGHPLGLMVGTVAIGWLIVAPAWRYGVLGLMVFAAIAPFALLIADPQPPMADAARAPEAPSRTRMGNFWLGWIGRALVVTAYSVAQTYLLFYLRDGLHDGIPGQARPEQGVAQLGVVFGVVSCAAALAAGRASDRPGRRRPLVIAGALMVAAGMTGLALAPGWPAAVAAYTLFGLGAGCHTAVEFALMTELLPSRERAGRDLGLLNISNIAPQVIAPLAAGLLMQAPGASIRWLFAAGAASAAAGALAIAALRRAP